MIVFFAYLTWGVLSGAILGWLTADVGIGVIGALVAIALLRLAFHDDKKEEENAKQNLPESTREEDKAGYRGEHYDR